MFSSKFYNCPGDCAHFPLIQSYENRFDFKEILQCVETYEKTIKIMNEFRSHKSYSRFILERDTQNVGQIIAREMTDKEFKNPEFEAKCGAVWGFGCCCSGIYTGFLEHGERDEAVTFVANANAIYREGASGDDGCGDRIWHFLSLGHHLVGKSLRKFFLCEKGIEKQSAKIVMDFFETEFNLSTRVVQSKLDFVTFQPKQDPKDTVNFNWLNYLKENFAKPDSRAGKSLKFIPSCRPKSDELREKGNKQRNMHRDIEADLFASRDKLCRQDHDLIVEKRRDTIVSNKMSIEKFEQQLLIPNPPKSDEPSKLFHLVKQALSSSTKPMSHFKVRDWICKQYPHLNKDYLSIFTFSYLVKESQKGTFKKLTGGDKIPVGSYKLEESEKVDFETKIEITNEDIGYFEEDCSSEEDEPSPKIIKLDSGTLISDAMLKLGGREGNSIKEIEEKILKSNPEVNVESLDPPILNWIETGIEKKLVQVFDDNGQKNYKWIRKTVDLGQSDEEDFQ